MIYRRRYVQFNDFVFDGYDMIRDDSDGSMSFKTTSTEYTYRHGNYVAFKKNHMIASQQTVSMTLKLRLKKLPCNMRQYYRDFAIGELTKPGKLWAVQNNELIWAYAYLTNYSELGSSERDTIEIDIDMVVYEGVWHKADKAKTFLKPYDVCSFLDCQGFKETPDPCKNCCTDCVEEHTEACCCDCSGVEKDWALCYFKDLQFFYKRCNAGYQIEYNCQKGQEFFGDDYLGTRLCDKGDCCDNIIAGQVYSDTDIPTDGITIILTGGAKNPWITINGNTNILEGEYDGTLTISPSGDVINTVDCCDTEVSPDKWVVPQGNSYGWEIHRGNNQVSISSCGTRCAYIQVDSLTI